MADSIQPVALVNIVGLTPSMLDERMPRLQSLARSGTVRPLAPVLPAVTCSVQASMVTGVQPAEHGIVGNGWYERDQAEIRFWKQSNHLVQAEKVWETARRRHPGFTAANCFWWYAMHASTDVTITPRPMYPVDGRKIPDIWTTPPALRDELQSSLGRFPLFNFWGPTANIVSTKWIADAARIVHDRFQPDLQMIYLPHLDYDLQRYGPADSRADHALAEIDETAGSLIEHLQRDGRQVIIVSEYGIVPVRDAVAPNRVLREAGMLQVREECGLELLDPGSSTAFVVADHQVGHVYVQDPAAMGEVTRLLADCDGVAEVMDLEGIRQAGLDHPRSGDLVLLSEHDRWFTWDYWLDDSCAPDFARTVDIHRKPGYDPRELFLAPGWAGSKPRLAAKLLAKKLGQRTVFDAISLDTSRIGGSHGRVSAGGDGTIILPGVTKDLPERTACTAVRDLVLDSLFGSTG
ncbi:MAG: alkaline phosphatase family protein [Phycisphaerales bacterium]|nr:alkaline phosphatase family protein [Phycisphaerales bacterium]